MDPRAPIPTGWFAIRVFGWQLPTATGVAIAMPRQSAILADTMQAFACLTSCGRLPVTVYHEHNAAGERLQHASSLCRAFKA